MSCRRRGLAESSLKPRRSAWRRRRPCLPRQDTSQSVFVSRSGYCYVYFTYGSSFATEAPEAYETLLLDALTGDASLFTRADEVEAAWAIVTPLDQQWAAWDKRGESADLAMYEAGTWGPGAADRLLERDGRRWRRL